MQNYIGTIIRKLRLKKHITQQTLCDGICTIKQLSRIEKNESSPSVYILSEISNRLGNDLLDYIPYSYNEDGYEIKVMIDEIVQLFDKGLYDKAFHIFTNADLLREKHCDYIEITKKLLYGALSYNIDTVESVTSSYYTDLLEELFEYHNITDVFNYFLRPIDLKLINSLIVTMLESKDYETAETLLIKSICFYETHYNKLSDTVYPRMLQNLSRLYLLSGEYDKCNTVALKGIHYCKSDNNYDYLPLLYNNYGRSLFHSGRKKEGIVYIKKYIYLRKILNPDVRIDHIIANLIKKYELKDMDDEVIYSEDFIV